MVGRGKYPVKILRPPFNWILLWGTHDKTHLGLWNLDSGLRLVNSILACNNLTTINTSPGFMKRDKLSLYSDL